MTPNELIEMMANAGYHAYKCGGYKDNAFHSIAKGMLSVIRQNVHLVSEPCDCIFDGTYVILGDDCKNCKGFGVIAKEYPCQTK